MRLAERLELLTRDFVDSLFAAFRASALVELRPELARIPGPKAEPRKRVARAGAKAESKQRPAKGARRTTKRPPGASAKSAKATEDEPKGDDLITNPEALLRAAFGDGPQTATPRKLPSKLPPTLAGPTEAAERAPSTPTEPERSLESRIGRVIRRKRQ